MPRHSSRQGGFSTIGPMNTQAAEHRHFGQGAASLGQRRVDGTAEAELEKAVAFLGDLCVELDSSLDPTTTNPHLNMALYLLRGHFEGRMGSAPVLPPVGR